MVVLLALLTGCGGQPSERDGADVPDVALVSELEHVRSRLSDPSFDPEAALLEAACLGDLATVELLLAKRGGVLASNPETERTALHKAALGGHADVVEALLTKAKARGVLETFVGMRDAEFRTPLLDAAAAGSAEIAALLLDAGALIDAGGRDGRRALHLAVLLGAGHLIDLLVERGAHVLARDRDGRNAADYARSLRRKDLLERLEAAAERQAQSEPVRAVRRVTTDYLDAVRRGDLALARSHATPKHGAALGNDARPAPFEHVVEDIEIHGDEARAIVRITTRAEHVPLLYLLELRKTDSWVVARTRIEVAERWEDVR